MKAKYGVDPQYPIERYVNGLTSTTVPDRDGEYPPGATSYVGDERLPEPALRGGAPRRQQRPTSARSATRRRERAPRTSSSTRTSAACPTQLLHFKPGDSADSAAHVDADWVKILGNEPRARTTTPGIDPHMIESYQPRSGLAAARLGERRRPRQRPRLGDDEADGRSPGDRSRVRLHLPARRRHGRPVGARLHAWPRTRIPATARTRPGRSRRRSSRRSAIRRRSPGRRAPRRTRRSASFSLPARWASRASSRRSVRST